MSSFQVEDCHLEGVEVLAQSPYTEILWGLEFECAREGSEEHFSIYTKNLKVETPDAEVLDAIMASGVCDVPESAKFVRAYRFRPE
jgi:predicted hydrolase (HD superfamily)